MKNLIVFDSPIIEKYVKNHATTLLWIKTRWKLSEKNALAQVSHAMWWLVGEGDCRRKLSNTEKNRTVHSRGAIPRDSDGRGAVGYTTEYICI